MVHSTFALNLAAVLESDAEYQDKFNAVYVDKFKISVGNGPIRARMIRDGFLGGAGIGAVLAIPAAVVTAPAGLVSAFAGAFSMGVTATLMGGIGSVCACFNDEAKQKARINRAVECHQKSLTKSEREESVAQTHELARQLITSAKNKAKAQLDL